jgi:hypothetical protein
MMCNMFFEGHSPDSLACDTTLRLMPDDSCDLVMLGGGHTEVLSGNQIFMSRSLDDGQLWSEKQ